ncbi:HlyD family secretion protein [Aquamicrobium terrae]
MSFWCALPLAAQLVSACAPAAPLAVGYVEGEFVLLAPIEVATVEHTFPKWHAV